MTETEMQLEALKAAFNQLMYLLGPVLGYNTQTIVDAYVNEYDRLKSIQAEISRDSDWDN